MGIHRPLRAGNDENLPRQSRPWDNGAIPPPRSAPLADFFNAPVQPLPPPRVGNRQLKPSYEPAIPPPLATLPLPPKPPASHPRDDAVESVPAVGLCIQDDSPLPHLSRSRTSSRPSANAGAGATRLGHSRTSAFSHRGSVSFALPDAPPKGTNRPRPQSKYHSIRLSTTDKLNFLPTSASFLDFNDDERLQKLDAEQPAQNPVWHGLSFDDADSFSTFGTLPVDNNVPPAPLPPSKEDMPRPDSNDSQIQALSNARPDDDDGGLDVPTRIVSRPGASDAIKDLQRASVTAGRELASSLRAMAEAEKRGARKSANVPRAGSVSQAQGELMMRSRILRRWNLRYASIVHQGYFGAVLLLFRPETKGVLGSIALRNSKMIALSETTVRRLESRKVNAPYMFEIRTSQRTYTFGCKDADGREFWVNQLSLPGGG